MNSMLKKYADLLVNYCVDIKPGDKLYVKTSTLAEPLVIEIYRAAMKAGAFVEVSLQFRDQYRIYLNEANNDQLNWVSPFRKKAMEEFDAYIYIMAPFNLKAEQNVDPAKRKIAKAAAQGVSNTYSRRTATRELKRNLCLYPTDAGAQNAGMSLEEYSEFVFGACNLYSDDPQGEWLKMRAKQKRIVDLLNTRETVRYVGEDIDISFSTKGRTWINSDGQTNMPSGEVYTSPVENSVNGKIRFSYPGLYMGREVEDVTLWVKDGEVQKWEAKRGKDFLDEIFAMDGARRFGEAAIGTNDNIQQMTRNILFDEKIGGTVHMAIGQSYIQAGGKNQSPVHWDMITEMKNGGMIFADDEKIYENGKFIF